MAMPEDEMYRIQKRQQNQATTMPVGNAPQQAQQAYQTVQQNRPQQVKIPTINVGQDFTFGQLKGAADQSRTAGMNVLGQPRTFDLNSLLGAVQQASQTGGPIGVPDSRFQTPEGIVNLITQMQQQMQPLADARTQAAQADFDRQQQVLRNQLAAQGSLSGGGAVSQQLQAGQDLGRFLDTIRAEQQAQAIPLAFDAANLGLNEAGQQFSMHDSNRQFAAAQAQNYVQNLMGGMDREEAMRQFQAGFEQQLAQNYFSNLQSGLGLQEDTRLGQQQIALQTAQLNNQSMQSWLDTLARSGASAADVELATREMMEKIRQFDQELGLKRDLLSEDQRQFNIGSALDMSKVFGTGVQPMSSGRELFNQVQGMPTLGSRELQQRAYDAEQDRNLRRWQTTYQPPQAPLSEFDKLFQGERLAAMQRISAGQGTPADYAMVGLPEWSMGEDQDNSAQMIRGIQSMYGTDQSTADVILGAWENPTRQSALADLNRSRKELEAQGYDVGIIQRAIDEKWPPPQAVGTQQQPNPFIANLISGAANRLTQFPFAMPGPQSR